MDSDSDSYYEESSDNEQEVAGPLHINVEVNVEEAPESPPPGSPELVLPEPIPLEEPVQVWELPDDGSNFLNYYTRADIIELRGGPRYLGSAGMKRVTLLRRPPSPKVWQDSCEKITACNGSGSSCSRQLI